MLRRCSVLVSELVESIVVSLEGNDEAEPEEGESEVEDGISEVDGVESYPICSDKSCPIPS
jgi:hypothetical protein